MNKNTVFIIFLSSLFPVFSCNFIDPKKITTSVQIVENDSVDHRVTIMEGGHITGIYHTKDLLKHGTLVRFFPDGDTSALLHFWKGYKMKAAYYDTMTKQLLKTIHSKIIREDDRLVAMNNEEFFYDERGEIIDSLSVGYLDGVLEDTINYGEDFRFAFKYLNRYYKDAELMICPDYTEFFEKKSNEPCETHTFQANAEMVFKTKHYKKGENVIRGTIKCYDATGIDTNMMWIFFEKTF